MAPLHAAEHFYEVTEAIEGLSPTMPALCDPDGCADFKKEAGKRPVGWFEPVAEPWGMQGIPEQFRFDTLPADYDHIAPLLEAAARRMPLLADTGIRLFCNGPESFTPGERYLLGPSPDVKGLYLACGFNSIGIQSSGGAGEVLADWIVDGRPSLDLWDVDVRRVMPFLRNKAYLCGRTVESPGPLYAMDWPYRQPETARGIRRSVPHDRLAAPRTRFGEAAGWRKPCDFVGAPLGLGYATRDDAVCDREWLPAGRYEIENSGERIGATLSLAPFHDPTGQRMFA